MRAIGTGKRGGWRYANGFDQSFGCAWTKQTGNGTHRRFVAKGHMVKRRLDGEARAAWRQVCDTIGKRYRYTLYLVNGKREMEVKVGKTTLTFYIDDKLGQYRRNWSEVAIRLIKGAR